MLYKAILTGTLVGFIFLFFSGWIFYDSLATDFFSQHYVNMPAMMAAEMNYIAPRGFGGSLPPFGYILKVGQRGV